jgi:hypothetical protein
VPAALIIATPVGLFSPQARSIPTNFKYPDLQAVHSVDLNP